MDELELIARIDLDIPTLMEQYPPLFEFERKRRLFELAPPPAPGRLEVTRWAGRVPERFHEASRPQLEVVKGFFAYRQGEPGAVHWHLNFADTRLFGFYGGALLAQDEHQVLEHPVLGSLREALLDLSRSRPELTPLTREGGPTPYLVKGAPRSLIFDTSLGTYGNAFARVPLDLIRTATTVLRPPTPSNIVAMAAPSGGYGIYDRETILDVLATAFVGFSACRAESAPLECVVHTGNWGCGAFGGNPVLMALLQIYAASLARVDGLVFHTLTPDDCMQATALFDELSRSRDFETDELLDRIHALRFAWGQSDGN